jgi:hypothetical protein
MLDFRRSILRMRVNGAFPTTLGVVHFSRIPERVRTARILAGCNWRAPSTIRTSPDAVFEGIALVSSKELQRRLRGYTCKWRELPWIRF